MSRTNAVLLAWLVTGGIAAAQSLEERVKALELKIEEQGGEGEAPEPGSPAAQALGKKIDVFFAEGIKFKSADGNLEAHLGGRVIVHYRSFEYHNERVHRDTFAFRQVKLHLQGKLWKDWEFKVELNSTGASVSLDDCYVGLVHWKQLQFRVGQFKAPFSLEELTSTRFIDLPERSLMNRLVPGREIGVMVHGEIVEKVLGYGLMASNGNGRNGPDENSDKDLTARVWVRPLGTSESEFLKNFHLAVNVTLGRQDKAANTAPYTFSDIMTGTVFANLGGDAPSVKFDEQRRRVGGELAWLFGRGSIKAEYTRTNDQYTNLDGNTDHGHTHFTAYYATATFMLTDDLKTWDRIRPNKPLFGSGGGIGAVELVARYSEFQINRDIMDNGYFNRGTSAREVHEYTAGVSWFPNMNTRITLAYSWINYSSDEHTEPLLISGKRIDHEDVILVRVQIDF